VDGALSKRAVGVAIPTDNLDHALWEWLASERI
jgi:hypothetical protein